MKSNHRSFIWGILVVLLYSQITFAQIESSRTEIGRIIEQANGKIGVAIIGSEKFDTLTFGNTHHFPMQSVYKLPLALTVLSEVDKGTLALNQNIHITLDDLKPNTWSPLREKYPNGNVDIPLSELLTYTVAQSDNNGCDILFRLLGGPIKVNEFVQNLGITGMSIVSTEEEMHRDEKAQYKNYSTPTAMAQLLLKFSRDSILSKPSTDFLWNVMVSTVTGAGRLKGKLPAGTKVAHKTGSSGVNKNGIAVATNDVGIVVLPNERNFIIVVFVPDSTDDEKTRDEVIANITKAAWDASVSNSE
ncbi:MAG: class A beta-lactamase, subclass A2 [Bacteroidetes bacterium]|nr:class A beta-lactamase, subclass A2 [Bacteroidota bacterium]